MEVVQPGRQPYPSDVSDEEWAFVAPYLTLMKEDAPQREHSLREVFNGLRWLARTGAQWRMLPHDLPPWPTVYQQTQRWLNAGVFEAIVHDLRRVLREAAGRAPEPTAVILDGRTIQSTPESGAGAGYDGYKRRKGRKVHTAVDTLGHLLALVITPANAQERAQVAELAAAVVLLRRDGDVRTLLLEVVRDVGVDVQVRHVRPDRQAETRACYALWCGRL